MNTDIRLSVCFRGHRKRKKLKRLIGVGYLDYLLDFWIGVALHRPSGVLEGWDSGDISDEAGWEGDPEEFLVAMIKSGFIGSTGHETLICHDWEKWQGWAVGAEARSSKAKKGAAARWKDHKKKCL